MSKLEAARAEMHRLAEIYGLSSPEALAASEALDRLIVPEQRGRFECLKAA